ncbi:MAG: hypothetical protein KGM42_15265 [Hyphomicrobiales bacterium]|nr:hypothetical protein [Hyphomicrobiales bacterium]
MGRRFDVLAADAMLAWRYVWLLAMHRLAPDAPPTLALTADEIALLDRLSGDRPERQTLSVYKRRLAAVAGRKRGATVARAEAIAVWRGLACLTDLAIAAEARAQKYLAR